MVYATVSQGFQTATASAEAAFHKVRETKFVDSMKTSYSFLREELSNTAPRRRRTRAAAAAAGPPPAENTQVTAVVPVVKKTTRWEKQWESLKEKV
jgi:import inner membrane translocase subunit TIM44